MSDWAQLVASTNKNMGKAFQVFFEALRILLLFAEGSELQCGGIIVLINQGKAKYITDLNSHLLYLIYFQSLWGSMQKQTTISSQVHTVTALTASFLEQKWYTGIF